MRSDTAKLEVTVKSFIDGDTVHFHVPNTVMEKGVLKGRFLAVNTPESTGKIEQYGKKASAYTKEKLSAATSIIIESETDTWNIDSTGGRYLIWVWYKTADMATYRNLNLELLQYGLARANSSYNNQYGSFCTAAIKQAEQHKLNLYSGQKDPDFYYGDAVELTLKELRTHMEDYQNIKVAFNGVVSTNSGSQGIYVESYDAETDLYFGIYVYYGHGLPGTGLDILSVGNEVRIVGTVQYYETGGTWQVSGLSYQMMKPDHPDNIQLIQTGCSASYRLTDPDTLMNSQVTLELEEETITADYAQLVMGTSVELKNLLVTEVLTTEDEESSSFGAMTLICQAGDVTVSVRTAVFYDEQGNLITEDTYSGKTINVKGYVDYFNGSYQVKVFTPKNITVINE